MAETSESSTATENATLTGAPLITRDGESQSIATQPSDSWNTTLYAKVPGAVNMTAALVGGDDADKTVETPPSDAPAAVDAKVTETATPPADTPATAPADPLAALADHDRTRVAELLAYAKTQNYDSIDAMMAGEARKQAEQEAAAETQRLAKVRETDDTTWRNTTLANLNAKWVAERDRMVTAGTHTEEDATALAIANREAEYHQAVAARTTDQYKAAEASRAREEFLRTRTASVEDATDKAIKADPILSAFPEDARAYIRNIALAGPDQKGLTDVATASKFLSDFVAKISEASGKKAVADYVAGEAAKRKNAAPIMNPQNGAGSNTTAPARPTSGNAMSDFLYSRAGLRSN